MTDEGLLLERAGTESSSFLRAYPKAMNLREFCHITGIMSPEDKSVAAAVSGHCSFKNMQRRRSSTWLNRTSTNQGGHYLYLGLNGNPPDRGSQYASHAFQNKLKAFGMTCSMSRKGNCSDNAPTESWFNSFKNERVYGIRYATHAEMKAISFEYIEVFYNRKRQHSTLGYQSPIQFLEYWVSKQDQAKLVA